MILYHPISFSVMLILYSLGMGIGDRQVYEGILITLGWLCLYLFLAVLIFRR